MMFFNDRRKKKQKQQQQEDVHTGFESLLRVPTEEDYARKREEYQRRKAHEDNMRKTQEWTERHYRDRPVNYDNFVNPRYVIGVPKYTSATPGRQPTHWL